MKISISRWKRNTAMLLVFSLFLVLSINLLPSFVLADGADGNEVEVTIRFPVANGDFGSFWESNSPATSDDLPHPNGLVITDSIGQNVDFTVTDVQAEGWTSEKESVEFTKYFTNYIVSFQGEIGASYHFRVFRVKDSNKTNEMIATDILNISESAHDFAFRSLLLCSAKPANQGTVNYNPTMTLTNSYNEIVPPVASQIIANSGIQGSLRQAYLILTSHEYDLRIVANSEYNIIEKRIQDDDTQMTNNGAGDGSSFIYYLNWEVNSVGMNARGYYNWNFNNFYGPNSGGNQGPLVHTLNAASTVKVTKGSDIGVYLKGGNHFAPFTSYTLTKDETTHDDDAGYDYYTGNLPQTAELHYEATIPSKLKQIGRFKLTSDNSTITMVIVSKTVDTGGYRW
jgi:hypothetical protein